MTSFEKADSTAVFQPDENSSPRNVIIHTDDVRSLYDGAVDLTPGHFEDTDENEEDISFLDIKPDRSTPMLRLTEGKVVEHFVGGEGTLTVRDDPENSRHRHRYRLRKGAARSAISITAGSVFSLRAKSDGLRVAEIYTPSFEPGRLEELES
jgi:hypothetical protein